MKGKHSIGREFQSLAVQGKELSYIELGLESLKSRRWFRNLCCFYKIKTSGLPSYLSNLISSGVHSHNTWNSKDVVTYPCRTETFKYPFFPRTGLDKSNSHLCMFSYLWFTLCLFTYFHIKIFVCVTCIPHEHIPFWQLSHLNHFTTDMIANLFI